MHADLQLVEGDVEVVVVTVDEAGAQLSRLEAELRGEDAHDAHLVLDAEADGGVELVEAGPLDGNAAALVLFRFQLDI